MNETILNENYLLRNDLCKLKRFVRFVYFSLANFGADFLPIKSTKPLATIRFSQACNTFLKEEIQCSLFNQTVINVVETQ